MNDNLKREQDKEWNRGMQTRHASHFRKDVSKGLFKLIILMIIIGIIFLMSGPKQ